MFSAHWYRVRSLRPALRSHLQVVPQVLRGVRCCLVHDPASGRSWRLPPRTAKVVALLDGRRTLDEVWAVAEALGEDMPTQDELLALIGQLHAADALQLDVAPDLQELLVRSRSRESQDRQRRYGNPLALRMRLWDPDRFLTRLLPLVQALPARALLVLWALVVLAGAVLALRHQDSLGRSLSDLALAPGSLVMAALVYPLIKFLHEMGHALCVKRRGGEVHEMGVLWMLAMPVPYVDASAATAFPDKRDRMWVSATGILVELFIAALAMIAWALVEPGFARSLAYATLLVAGVSTLLVNGNPLLRYDGYYLLADLLEIPNLAQRANAQAGHLFRRWVLGQQGSRPPAETRGEAFWLTAYAPAAWLARLLLMAAIVAMVAQWSRGAALALAAVLLATQLAWPAIRGLRRLAADAELRAAPARLLRHALVPAAALALLAFVPLPHSTVVQGVMWLPEQGEVRARTDGELVQWLAPPGTDVTAGQPLALLEDRTLEAQVATAEAGLRAAESAWLAARADNAVDAGMMLRRLDEARAQYEAARERAATRTLRSPAAGRFVVARPADQQGRYLRQGDTLGYVVPPGRGTVIAMLDQDQIGLLRTRLQSAEVRATDAPARVLAARIERLTPAGENRLPSAALGHPAGGPIAVDPQDPDGRRALEPVFRVELSVERTFGRLGGRAWVRFDHGTEALASRAWRATRQLLLRHLDA